jgi:hypothetical protein
VPPPTLVPYSRKLSCAQFLESPPVTGQPAQPTPAPAPAAPPAPPKKRRRIWRILAIAAAVLTVVLVGVRLALPSIVRWQVNQILNQSPLYSGKIDDIQISLWRGAYSIQGVSISKTTGNIPVPLFTAKTVDLALQWDALLSGSLVGRVTILEPEINFVDAPDISSAQGGAQGPWLTMIRELFPLRINSCRIVDGTVRFHAFHKTPPVDLHASSVNINIENLTNISNEVTPMVTTVQASGLVMNHAKFEFRMQLDPFSYYPTFQLAFRLLALDVTKINDLTRAYGMFDYEQGWFDLVVDLECSEGQLSGYIKPLFRNVRILSLDKDIKEDNVIEFFWEALLGGVTAILTNQSRDQFGTKIPIEGSILQPQPLILETLGNILRNAFVRAYLPRLSPRNVHTQIQQTMVVQDEFIQFKPGSALDPAKPDDDFQPSSSLNSP